MTDARARYAPQGSTSHGRYWCLWLLKELSKELGIAPPRRGNPGKLSPLQRLRIALTRKTDPVMSGEECARIARELHVSEATIRRIRWRYCALTRKAAA